MCCVSKTSVDQFLHDYEQDMINYPAHTFRASWQHEQMSVCIKNLKEDQVIMIMDFTESNKCSFQNKVQSAYFDQNMVTIHPMMCYYKKQLGTEETAVTEKRAIIGIVEDLRHDGYAVSVIEKKAIDIIQETVKVNEIIQWTDDCAALYKSKNCLFDISNQSMKLTRNYFETSHGKNVCDGLGAVIKCSCYWAMLSGKVLGDAMLCIVTAMNPF